MTLVKIKGLKRYKSRGREYLYHRPTNTRIRSEPGSAAFVHEIQQLEKKAATRKATAGTVVRLVEDYKTTSAWTKLAEATRTSYQRAFNVIVAGFGERRLVEITPPFLARFRDLVERKRKRWMANYVLTVMAILCDHAIEQGTLSGENPARVVKRVRKPQSDERANRPWTRSECSTVLGAAAPYLRVPIALAMFGGFRKEDVLALRQISIVRRVTRVRGEDVEIDCIVRRTGKRGVDVVVPMHAELARVLTEAPRHAGETVAVNSRGEPWTESGFNSTFHKLIRSLEKADRIGAGLTFHGLRHTVGTRLFEAGAEIEDIKRLLGQRSAAMAQHYSETADVTGAHSLLIGEMKVVDPIHPLDNRPLSH